MLYPKEHPKGIDIPIQRLQSFLDTYLPGIWGIDGNKYACYGRAYRNQKEGGYIPEVYIGNDNYRDAFHDDSVDALSFFGVEDKQVYDIGALTANVYLIFCVNIEKLKPSIRHRADEEIHRDVIGLIEGEIDMTGLVTGIASVFSGYDIKRINYRDMHPKHCFRINYTVQYTDECK